MSDRSHLDMDLRETVLVLGKPFLLEVRRASGTTIIRRTRLSVAIIIGRIRVVDLVDKQDLV
jgi:hypothetical protein